jgi:asparagine synthase (glutamine-hydrolysing)
MCGINGFVDLSRTLDENQLRKSTDIISHRGPDDAGYNIFQLTAATIGLGHRRLSILDLSALGHQPMFDRSGKYAIIFNGEVYNFQAIRDPLIKAGYRFNSNSDTEVILYALIHYGMKAIDQFIGMFTIAFLDVANEKLFLIRDRAGVKPLYYHIKEDRILFSSELKSFHQYDFFKKNINREAVKLFFQYGYIPAPHSIFMDTFKLLPGHYMEINCRDGKSNLIKYWDVYDYYNQPKLDISEDEAFRETETLLHSAFNYRMVSDVPVGVFFSGGYDSATLAAILQSDSTQKIKTFTIGFHEEEYNEAPHAKKIAKYLGTDHHEYYCTHTEAAAIIPELPYFFDEPFGDASAIPTMLVSRFARSKVTVALSADAGDEIFGGYNRYGYLSKIQNNLKYFPGFLSGITSKMMNAVDVGRIPYLNGKTGITNRYRMLADVIHTKDVFEHNTILSSKFNKKQIEALLGSSVIPVTPTFFDSLPYLDRHNDVLSKILGVDFKTYLPDDILVKVDRATMSVALEGREPFIDHRIIEWVARMPIDLKIRKGHKKYLLKKIAEKYIPAEMLNRPKMGFGVPITVWFRNELQDLFNEYLGEKAVQQNEYLDGDYIARLKRNYFNNPSEDEASKIWLPLMFQMWWKKWMN